MLMSMPAAIALKALPDSTLKRIRPQRHGSCKGMCVYLKGECFNRFCGSYFAVLRADRKWKLRRLRE